MLVLGMVILMIEAFAGKIDKSVLAFAAIAGLAIVLLRVFLLFLRPRQSRDRFLELLHGRSLAIFFKHSRC